jgi:hypothetical protein
VSEYRCKQADYANPQLRPFVIAHGLEVAADFGELSRRHRQALLDQAGRIRANALRRIVR